MRGTRHSEEQIIGILKQAEKGLAASHQRYHLYSRGRQQQADILSVRRWYKASQVEDGDALQCLGNGQGVFDVSADGMKLDRFLRRHKLLKYYRDNFTGLCGNRVIHMAFRMESIH